jgi:hypothetical protein
MHARPILAENTRTQINVRDTCKPEQQRKEAQSWDDMARKMCSVGFDPGRSRFCVFRMTKDSSSRVYVPNSGLGDTADAVFDDLPVRRESTY